MNTHLRTMLQLLLVNPVIVGSWGITDIIISDESLSFTANGMKYEGVISVECEKDSPDYTIHCKSSGISYYHVNLNSLLKTLDNIIEQTDDYIKDIAQWIIKA